MLLIANLINPAQHRVDQMNTFPAVGLGRGGEKKKKVGGLIKNKRQFKGMLMLRGILKDLRK